MRCSSLRWRMLRIRARLLIDGLAAESVMAVFHDATNRFICEFNLGRPCLCLSSLSTCWTASPVCPPESQRSHRHRSTEHDAAISDLDCALCAIGRQRDQAGSKHSSSRLRRCGRGGSVAGCGARSRGGGSCSRGGRLSASGCARNEHEQRSW